MPLLYGVSLSLLAGLSISIGALLAHVGLYSKIWSKQEVRHCITAIGGGALISAIALILVPEGSKLIFPSISLIAFFSGGLVFMLADTILANNNGNLSIFMAMMLDFIPEAIILGAFLVSSPNKALFLALIIASQNIPEGYSSFLELLDEHHPHKLLLFFLIVGLTGPLYVFIGWFFFVQDSAMLGSVMLFCSGGILYLVFEDIAPRVIDKKHWLPTFGTILGFMIGLYGYLYI